MNFLLLLCAIVILVCVFFFDKTKTRKAVLFYSFSYTNIRLCIDVDNFRLCGKEQTFVDKKAFFCAFLSRFSENYPQFFGFF